MRFALNHLGRDFEIVFALTNPSEGRLFAVASLYEKPRWTGRPIQRSKAYLDRAGNIFWKPDDTFSDFALPHESVLDFIFKILLDVPAASIDSAKS
ncbi:hypothetical protein [Sulfurifustis variabilis]|uniref:hypothetical protein n=1 Tax=Sulfurifustis variabilis TaxID=1675686 RepID=UPI0011E4D5FD|nr:hypothetical protein [Sulfurifustis variabilis]